MSSPHLSERRKQAAKAASRIIAMLDDERQTNEILLWRNRFLDISDLLASTELTDIEAVQGAVEHLRRLSTGGRSVADFYLVRTDLDEQRRLNTAFGAELDKFRNAVIEPDPAPMPAIDFPAARANLRASAFRAWLLLLAGIGSAVLAVFLIDRSVNPDFLISITTQLSGVFGILGTVFGAAAVWLHHRKSRSLRRHPWTAWPITYIGGGRYEWVALLGPTGKPVTVLLLSTWPHQRGKLINHTTMQAWFAGDPLRYGVISRPGGSDLRYAYIPRHTIPPRFLLARNDETTPP
ncbi:hypothetical protein GPX89_34215 [Nocardia sp. ET3-3]|uniref:Uncharacterized protein n=1 Tax=Nocardia terrae TaxID=2675851 RepID=A0A7K1V6L4_9NOCA|nr:hypothetical protein [Nocardia terrae]MVU82280.1 hypothetical protein [Nocardia terrae]